MGNRSIYLDFTNHRRNIYLCATKSEAKLFRTNATATGGREIENT